MVAGDLLRQELGTGTSPHAVLIQSRINEGDVVPAELIMHLIKAEMNRAMSQPDFSSRWKDGVTRFLFDGFPRDLEQTYALKEHVCLLVAVMHYEADRLSSRLLRLSYI
jgi:adenylate kinase family enzyme